MKKIFLLMFSACLLLTSCIDGDDPKPFFYGFATVDKNPLLGSVTFKSDLNETGTSYTYKALNDVDPNNKLNDGDRVYMSCTIETDYGTYFMMLVLTRVASESIEGHFNCANGSHWCC